MGSRGEIPSLSDLRRSKSRGAWRGRAAGPTSEPGLFDSLPWNERDAPGNGSPEAARVQDAAVRVEPQRGTEPVQPEVSVTTIESQSFVVRQAGAERRGVAVRDARTNFAAEEEAFVWPGVGAVQVEVAEVTAPEPRVWSVGDLVRQVRGLVERSYGQVWVEGEVSNWRPASSGHCYFTLKDGGAQLSVVMFRKQASLLRFQPKDGDAVRVRGQLSIYESRGQMQMVAEWLEQVGLGAQLAAVRELKERLRREGLFERKRPMPPFPNCIGVVTSVQGAALRDIVKVCRRRHAAVRLLIYPAAVQGPRCAAELAEGVRWFSRHPERADVVLVARGGGSWEDLHGFDDEGVARAIAGCSLPVIVGVGHATDSTIADAAADVCAPTPSAAAELLTAAQHQVEERVERLSARLGRAVRYETLQARQRLMSLSAEVSPRVMLDALRRREQRLDEAGFHVEAAAARLLRSRGSNVARLDARLRRRGAESRLAENRRQLGMLEMRLGAAPEAAVRRRAAKVESAAARLDGLNPLRVLERGYALVYGPDGRLLRSTNDVSEGAEIVARLADGRLRAAVRDKLPSAVQPEQHG